MKVTVFFVCFFAAAWALPKGEIELPYKELYVDPIGEIDDLIPRIMNGVEAEPHSIPYQAYIIFSARSGSRWLCGGSLISPRHVLTAGHCVDNAYAATVYLGSHNIQQAENTRIIIQSQNLILHENYDEINISNDIGIVVFDEPVELNEYIGTVPLPSRKENSNFEGVNARVSGWGRVAGEAADSPVLLWVNSTVISNTQCRQRFIVVIDSQLCTDGTGGVGTCRGDSGGPLVYNNFQIGIVSYGASKCAKGYPSGFTRITSYLDWIEKHTGLMF